jgi:hypothetical protein
MSKSVVRKKIFSKGSHPSSGGGGGGDMFKATYDPANLARQVITTAISIGLLDFVDLVNKTNINGNNTALDGLLPNQTYAVSGMDNFGYNADCLYYVTTVTNDNNDVVPATSGFLTAPFSASSNVYRLSVRWNSGSEAPFACEIDSNVFYYISSIGAGELDRTQINGTTSVGLTNNRFYGNWVVTTSFTNAGLNVSLNECDLYNNVSIDIQGDEGVQLTDVILRSSSVYFNSKSGDAIQRIRKSTIEQATVTFADNTSASTNSVLQNCTVKGLDLTIGVDVILTGCTFIGKGTGYAISIPDGANYTGKTFVEGEWSDFDTTIDLNAAVTGNQLDLPNSYRFFVGIYNTTNAARIKYNIEAINIGSEPTHKFKIYGNADDSTTFVPTGIGGSANDGQFFATYVMTIAGLYILADTYDYLEFKKDNIKGEPDALRITDYGILG